MKLRVISSIIAIFILFLFLFYLPRSFFYIFVFIISCLSILELHKMTIQKVNFYFFLSVIFNGIFFFYLYQYNINIFFELLTITFLLLAAYLVFKYNDFKKEFLNITKFLFSIFYITMIATYAILIYNFKEGDWFLLNLLLICWATDSFAFLIGSNFGKKKLCEQISPNKTVEGFLGGLAGGVILGVFGVTFLKVPVINLIIMSFLTSFSCVAGDLFESLIKRKFNVKDSGKIIPGHGGILDRIDGILFAIPTYYFLTKVLL